MTVKHNTLDLKKIMSEASEVKWRFCPNCAGFFDVGPSLYVPVGQDHMRVCQKCRTRHYKKVGL